MRFAFIALLVVLLTPGAFGADAAPKMTEVTPDTGKAGTEFTVSGENLTKTHVAEVFLTDGKNDLKCDIVEQQAAQIKLKAPKDAKPGRFALMILTADRTRFLEQPVKVTIE